MFEFKPLHGILCAYASQCSYTARWCQGLFQRGQANKSRTQGCLPGAQGQGDPTVYATDRLQDVALKSWWRKKCAGKPSPSISYLCLIFAIRHGHPTLASVLPSWHKQDAVPWHHGHHGLIDNKDLLGLPKVFEETSELLLCHLCWNKITWCIALYTAFRPASGGKRPTKSLMPLGCLSSQSSSIHTHKESAYIKYPLTVLTTLAVLTKLHVFLDSRNQKILDSDKANSQG